MRFLVAACLCGAWGIGGVMLHGCSNGFSGGSKDDHGGSCNGGDPCAGGEGGVPIGGSAGADSGGGASGRGGSGEQGGAGNSSGSGGDQGGIAGEGGADTGGSGNAPTGGRAGSGGESGGAGSGDAGMGGSGGAVGGGDPACDPPTLPPFVDESFDSDVFASAWMRSDGSVSVSGGLLRIAPDGGVDDYAQLTLPDPPLPVMFEVRERVRPESTANALLPMVNLRFTGESLYITSSAALNTWQFVARAGPTGSQPSNWTATTGTWITLRALITSTGGTLCAKKDDEAGFTVVATSGWSIPLFLTVLSMRQHNDDPCEFDYVRMARY